MNRLILPVYYVTCDQFEEGFSQGSDPIVDLLKARNWTDWRALRFKSFGNEEVSSAMAALATMIKATSRELEGIFAEADKVNQASDDIEVTPDRPKSGAGIVGGASTPSLPEETIDKKTTIADVMRDSKLLVPEARSLGELDAEHLDMVRNEAYYAYTKRFDEVVRAAELATTGEAMQLYQLVSKHAAEIQSKYKKKISGFARKLSKIAPNSVSVTLLCDNSGSMGLKILSVACWASILTEVLETASIPTEVLGYTTRAWKGGQSHELWLADKTKESRTLKRSKAHRVQIVC